MSENGIYLPHPKKRLIFFAGDVEQESLGYYVKKKILEINESDALLVQLAKVYGFEYKPKPIKLYLDSYGGDIYSALGLVGVIEASNTPIWTYYTGSAMSSGFIILISGHRRFCYKHSTLMYHQISSDSSGGEARKQEMDVEENTRLMEIMEEIVVSKTKISKNKLKKIYSQKEDWYIDPQQALKLEIIDEIIERENEEEAIES